MSNHVGTPSEGKKLLEKQQLKPLEVTGITTVTIGTGIWALAFLGTLLFRSTLADQGRSDWVWIALAGTVLGLLGIRYTKRRAARIAKSQS